MIYADFETSKKLAEIGFPQSETGEHFKANGEIENGLTDLGEGVYYSPRLDEIEEWLEKKHSLYLTFEPKQTFDENNDPCIGFGYIAYRTSLNIKIVSPTSMTFKSRMEAAKHLITHLFVD